MKTRNYRGAHAHDGRDHKLIVFAAAVAALALIALAMLGLLRTLGKEPAFTQGQVEICVEGDGTHLKWPASEQADFIRVYTRGEGEEEFTLSGEYEGDTAVLPSLAREEPVEIRIVAVHTGYSLFGQPHEQESSPIELTVTPRTLPQPVVRVEIGEDKVLKLRWEDQADRYEICLQNESGGWDVFAASQTGEAAVRFGAELAIPSHEAPLVFAVRASEQGNGYVLCSPYSAPIVIERQMLMDTALDLDCEKTGERTYTLRWNETRGDHYEVQQWLEREEKWTTLARVDRTGERRYDTGRLASGADYRFRVIACSSEAAWQGSDTVLASAPGEVQFRTEISSLYCTVWPIQELTLYQDTDRSTRLLTVPAGAALCVLEEEKGLFRVRYNSAEGWLDANFCLINLPEYVGDLCAYDITNSYASIFRIHEYDIPGITGGVVKGYENVRLDEDDYLVPFLYPCADKLIGAAKAAEADGYRLRIYDAFRPHEATRFLYDTTSAVLDQPVPETEEPDGEAEDVTVTEPEAPAPEPVPEPEPGDAPPADDPDAAADDPEAAAQAEEPEAVEEPPAPVVTYGSVMTDNRFGLSAFLAASTSAHNRGIALDLTLERIGDGEVLEMQSAMHDLSWYSILANNNENARRLSRYMLATGMRGLNSEWWHFQDDDTRDAIGLDTYLEQGVSIEGWKKDDDGWRYRLADGRYCRSDNLTIDGRRCMFDAAGYLIES